MYSKSKELKQEIVKLANKQLDILSSNFFSELIKLPAQNSEDIICQENKLIISIWHDVLESQEHRIVVQVYKPGRLGIGYMYADGFAINSGNEKRALTQQELADFR